MVPNLAHLIGHEQAACPSLRPLLGFFDVTNGFLMRALFSSDWFLPMMGGFAIGGLFVFGTNPLFATLF